MLLLLRRLGLLLRRLGLLHLVLGRFVGWSAHRVQG
jgi:hypothetical protein